MSSGTGAGIVGIELITTGANSTAWEIGFNSVEYLYFVEDLYSFCVTGKICFRDQIGISEFGPLNGSEKIRIRFCNTENNEEYKIITLNVHKIEKIERIQEHRASSAGKVTLLLVDENYRLFHSKFWSKSWRNTKISDIIKDIAKNHIGIEDFVEFEGTREYIEHFDTHNRTPAECINWLMNRGSGVKTRQPGFLFYRGNNTETEDFGFNFTTLENLLRNKEWMGPYENIEGSDVNIAPYYFENDNPDYINKIIDHKVFNVDLTSLKSLSGGSVLGWDIKRKKLLQRDFTYQDAINRFTILGKKSLFPSELNLDHQKLVIDGGNSSTFFSNLWYGRWIREYSNQQQVHITVNGHPQRKAGGMIRIVWPSHSEIDGTPYDAQEIYNKQMDGRYLVKSITNYFDGRWGYGWRQKLVCIKNGYGDSPNPNLVDAVNRNL